MLQFIEQRMNENHEVTLGVEFASRTINVKNKNVKFLIFVDVFMGSDIGSKKLSTETSRCYSIGNFRDF